MRISEWSSDVCSSDHQRRRLVAADPHARALACVDDISRKLAARTAVHRDGHHGNVVAIGDRAEDRRQDVACATALRVEIEETVALAQVREHSLAIGAAVVAPGPFGDSRNRALQRRPEARRVGKEGVGPCRSRWSPNHEKKQIKKEPKSRTIDSNYAME